MKKLTRHYSRVIAALLILALLCVSGCTGSESIMADEDNSFTCYEEYAEYYDDKILEYSLELAKVLGDSWYRDGDSAVDSSEHGWLLDYAVTAHTPDGRGVIAIHVPGSEGMSQIDFILLTTDDYGKTWDPGDGVYHIVGGVAQITINKDYIYIIVDSGAYENSCILMSDDFGSTFEVYNVGRVIPAEHRARMSDLLGVYMRIINVENDGEIVLKCFCRGDMEYISFDDLPGYDSSAISDMERTLMLLSSDARFSEVKTLYADERIF